MAKGRHNNQDRVVAPELDTRLQSIAQACVRSGFPPNLCDTLAEGYVFRLRRRCWSNLTDSVGTGDDVERMVGWQGPPRVLSHALENAGYLRDVKGVYLAVDCVAEAPEYIKARWRRHNKAAYDDAAARATAPNVLHPRPVERDQMQSEWEEDAMPQDTLFGMIPDVPEEKGRALTPHAKFSKYFDDAYRKVYPRGYLWGRKADERRIKQLLEILDSLTECYAVIDAFFADRCAFNDGHPLWKLCSGIDKYRAAKPRGAVVRNPGKSQADTSAVIARN